MLIPRKHEIICNDTNSKIIILSNALQLKEVLSIHSEDPSFHDNILITENMTSDNVSIVKYF